MRAPRRLQSSDDAACFAVPACVGRDVGFDDAPEGTVVAGQEVRQHGAWEPL